MDLQHLDLAGLTDRHMGCSYSYWRIAVEAASASWGPWRHAGELGDEEEENLQAVGRTTSAASCIVKGANMVRFK